MHFSLETHDGLLHFLLLYQGFCFFKQILVRYLFLIHIWILFDKVNDCWIFCHLEFIVFIPHLTPCTHHLVHLLHISSSLHPLLHHLIYILLIKLFIPLKDVLESITFCVDQLLCIVNILLHFLWLVLTQCLIVILLEIFLHFGVLHDLLIFFVEAVDSMVDLEEELQEL